MPKFKTLRSSFLVFFFFIKSFELLFAQKAIDTLNSEKGRIVIYDNRTWSLLNESTFKGVLNERIHALVSQNSPPLNQAWNHEACYTGKNNDHSKLKDTILLNLNEKAENDFAVPVKGIVTSRYGYRDGRYHNGIDLALKIGDTVYAAFSGKIRYAKYNDGGFGNLVIIRHYNGLETFYAHLSKHLVVPNQEVKSGQPIGLGGITGRSFGPHLHFEVRFYDGSINPEEIIDFTTKKLKRANLYVHKGIFLPGAKPSVFYEPNDPDSKVIVKTEVEKPITPVVKVKPAQKKYYTVKSGDTLTEVAARNKTTVAKICQLNGIKSNSKLQVGKSLRIR